MPIPLSPLRVQSVAASAAGGDTIRFTFPNDFNVAHWGLRITGNLVVGVADALGLNAGGIANIIKRIRVDAKGESRMDIAGKFWRIHNQIMNQGRINETQPSALIGTNAFEICLVRQQQIPRLMLPLNDRGILPVNIIRDVQVVVDIGTPADVAFPDAATTLAFSNVSVEFFVIQALPTPSDPTAYVNERLQTTEFTSILDVATDRELLVNTGGLYRYIAVVAESIPANAPTAFVNDAVSRLRLQSNRTEQTNMEFLSLQGDNQMVYQLQDFLTGVAVLDYTRNFSPMELLDANKLQAAGSDLKLLVTSLGAYSADSKLTLLTSRIFGNLIG